jgi:hypothetical protein
VDLAGIQNRLAALGVSLRFESDPANIADELHDQREYRAALYIDRLEAARTFLTTTLAGPGPNGLGADYPFVAAALARGELLNKLAAGLDEWVCPAVERAANIAIAAAGPGGPTNYQTWFTSAIFNVNDLAYQANVATFFGQYPITDHALTQIRNNFQDNIDTALRRVLADRAAIVALFSDRFNGLTLTGLSQITSSGSDFHKGGQQVLFLTFTTRYWYGFRNWVPAFSTLKLAYKPGDVEIDCLIAGESAAVNRARNDPAYLAQSLVEIFNAYVAAHPAPGLEPLPTYRILPCLPVARPGRPLNPVRDTYGYLEYLSYAFTGQTWGAFNYYPFGASDFLIFQYTAEAPIIQRFYHQAGQFLALATAFSLTDLHVENVRVTEYQPRLIDLEASLTAPVANVTKTLLIAVDVGGFNGASRANEDFVYRFVDLTVPFRTQVNQVFVPKWYANRLWALRPDRRLVPVNAFWLLQGLSNGMDVIRAIQQAGGFGAWLLRTNNVLVRVLPVPTQTWIDTRSQIYFDALRAAPPVPLAARVAEIQLRTLTALYDDYVGQPVQPPEPVYVAANAAQVNADLTNFDIPSFYHRIGTRTLLDSAGAVIPVPVQVTVYNNADPPVAGPVNTNVGRVTYFAAAPTPPPTTARVGGQLNALAGGGFAAAVAAYQQQSLGVLGLGAVPPIAPGVLI